MSAILQSEQALEVLTTISLAEILVLGVILMSGVFFGLKSRKKIKRFLETYRETENRKEQVLNQIHANKKEIEHLKIKHNKSQEELLQKHHKQKQHSLEKYAEIDKQFETLIDRIDSLAKILEQQHQETQKIKRNELREQLLKSYRFYTSLEKNPSQTWNEMEAEAWWHTYSDYEALGGNGYIAAEVKTAMKKLTVTSI